MLRDDQIARERETRAMRNTIERGNRVGAFEAAMVKALGDAP